ncbi:hypothetical protein HanIR_Chr17g0891491 [Helianthus annuus]|nr:hypothetical protein HanIR_Chr17g0891491 [Helianthus annuus]
MVHIPGRQFCILLFINYAFRYSTNPIDSIHSTKKGITLNSWASRINSIANINPFELKTSFLTTSKSTMHNGSYRTNNIKSYTMSP